MKTGEKSRKIITVIFSLVILHQPFGLGFCLPQHLLLVLQLWQKVNLKMYGSLCIKSACRVVVQPLCVSAHPTQSPAGIANASITTATAPTSSVPLRDLLQQLGVCEELQEKKKKKKSEGKEAIEREGEDETNARGRERGHGGKGIRWRGEGMK